MAPLADVAGLRTTDADDPNSGESGERQFPVGSAAKCRSK